MEDQRTNQEASFEHSVNNTRLENQANELLAQVRARVLARAEKGTEQTKTGVCA